MGARVLISAGEASGDLYAAALVEALRRRNPDLEFFGCAGPRMQRAGVHAVVDAASISVVGLVEVVTHIPRIWREYRKLLRAAVEQRPDIAILTDSPDFHLRLARRLKKLQIPVIWLIAPQVWAWRKGRLPMMRRTIDQLLCIFPFEPEFFVSNGMDAVYLGHPLTRMVKPSASRAELRRRYGIPDGVPLVALLPGSRKGEVARHLPILLDTVDRIARASHEPAPKFILAVPPRVKFDGTHFRVVHPTTRRANLGRPRLRGLSACRQWYGDDRGQPFGNPHGHLLSGQQSKLV